MLRATFRQLETFVLVAKTGSFAAAAERLGVSPAAVSDQVRALEKKLGHKLFDRRRGTVPVLNDRGTALLRKAPNLLDSANEVESLTATVSTQRVRVGAGDYILEHVFLPNIASFQLAHPDTYIEFVRLGSSQDALQSTNSQRIDLAYLALTAPSNEPTAEFIGISSPSLLISPKHPFVSQATYEDAPTLPMLMPLPGSVLERAMLQILNDAGITDFEVVTRAQHADTLINLACAGVGVVCVMREHAREALKQGLLVELDIALQPLYRFAFRRPDALDVAALRQVDEFAVSLLKSNRAH